MANVRAHVFVSGRVQRVFYRVNAIKEASRLKLKGWVRNVYSEKLKVKSEKLQEFTGVEAVFEGEREKVEEMIEWCKKGSSSAKVGDVEVEWGEPEGLESFEIRK